MKDYREIRPEFTVDRFTDITAPTANINSFARLVNFIPKKGRVETRFGIGELLHTPDTTVDPVTGIDPTTDVRCRMVLDFEDYEKTNSALGTNTGANKTVDRPFTPMIGLSNSGAATYNTYDPTAFKQGSKSLWLSDETAENSACG